MASSRSVFKLDFSLNISHILTLITIAVSVVALYQSIINDVKSREKEQADQVRQTAVNTLAKFERWQDLQLSLYMEVQPVFVEASEMLFQDEASGVYETRDFLWKELNAHRTLIETRVLQEEIEVAYIELLSHFPSSDELFLNAFSDLDTIAEDNFYRFLDAMQKDIESMEGQQENYVPATLGNRLRETGYQYQTELKTETDQRLKPVRAFLFDVIKMSDKNILSSSGR